MPMTQAEVDNLKPGDRVKLKMHDRFFYGEFWGPTHMFPRGKLVRFYEPYEGFHDGHGSFVDNRGYYITRIDLQMWSLVSPRPPTLREELHALWEPLL